MLPAQKILEVTANGTTTWEFPMVQFGEPSNDKAGHLCIRASIVGSGAVAATVAVYRGSLFDATIRYDDTPAVTFTLAGTNISTASQEFRQTGDVHWKFVVSGISGSSTLTVVAGWWDA